MFEICINIIINFGVYIGIYVVFLRYIFFYCFFKKLVGVLFLENVWLWINSVVFGIILFYK